MKNEALNVYEAFKKVLGESEAKMIVQYLENTDKDLLPMTAWIKGFLK